MNDVERVTRAKEITNDIHDVIDDNINDIDMLIDVFVAALSATIDRRSSRTEDTIDCIDYLCKNLYKDR